MCVCVFVLFLVEEFVSLQIIWIKYEIMKSFFSFVYVNLCLVRESLRNEWEMCYKPSPLRTQMTLIFSSPLIIEILSERT